MMIQSLKKNYIVIRYCFSDENMERCICEEELKKARYTIVRIKNRQWITKALEFFMHLGEDKSFTDFDSCFFYEESLCVVMKYAQGLSLKEKLDNENGSLEERLVIGEKIMEKLLLQNMPDYFLKDCLKAENIILSRSMDVGFQYELSRPDDYDKVSFRQVQNSLLKIFSLLFDVEIKKKMIPIMLDFCDSLRKGEFEDILAIYTAYNEMCGQALTLIDSDKVEPGTWIFCLWEKIKTFFPVIKRIAAAALMIMAVIFLFYNVRRSMFSDGEKQTFEYIGTLEIQ